MRQLVLVGGVALVVVVAWLGGSCLVDDSLLNGKACGPERACAGGYACVGEPCEDHRVCWVCRLEASEPDGGEEPDTDGADSENLPDDAGPTCEDDPPACKTLPGCEDIEPRCEEGAWICDTGFEADERSCDGVDNDCDGQTDERLVCTLAGDGTAALVDGTAVEARFNQPRAMLLLPSGDLVVVDSGNHALRSVAVDGSVTTLTGTGRGGFKDGPAREAVFKSPASVALAPDGALIITDSLNNRIRKLAQGSVSTVAGSGFADYVDGEVATASFAVPTGVAVDASGVIYIADSGNNCIRVITGNQVSTLAGKCETRGFLDGTGQSARFNAPTDLLLLQDGALLVSEESSHSLRRVSADGTVVTVAGTGSAGFVDGAVDQAQFCKPAACVLDFGTGLILVADSGNDVVRAIDLSANVTTLLGSGAPGMDNGPALKATFRSPGAVGFLSDGRLVVADTKNHALRVVMP